MSKGCTKSLTTAEFYPNKQYWGCYRDREWEYHQENHDSHKAFSSSLNTHPTISPSSLCLSRKCLKQPKHYVLMFFQTDLYKHIQICNMIFMDILRPVTQSFWMALFLLRSVTCGQDTHITANVTAGMLISGDTHAVGKNTCDRGQGYISRRSVVCHIIYIYIYVSK